MKQMDLLTCKLCSKSFQKKFDFIQHDNIHCNKKPFLCPVCYDCFATVEDYVKHAVNHEFYNCKSCKSVFESKKLLIEHKCHNQEQTENGIENCREESSIKETNVEEKEIFQVERSKFMKERRRKKLSKKNFQCNYCLKIFLSSKTLISHLKCHKHDSSESPHKCTQCNIPFKSIKKYKIHKRNLHAFSCEHCDKQYTCYEKLQKHVCFVSSNGEPFKCSCSQTFNKANAFKVHVGVRPYSCCSCSMQFNTITNLIRHIRTHTKQKPYICKECGRGFSQSANLRNHSSVHLGISAVKCDECNFSCKTQSGLFKHKKKHKEGLVGSQNYVDGRKTSTGTFSCPLCKKQFLFKRNAGMHMKVHRKKECLCTECGKVFDSKSKLTAHYKACHGEPSVCKTCGKMFASAVLLAAHEKTHVSDKQFTCNVCFKMFSIKNYLVQHMKTHNDGKQFSCSKCGKLFKVAASLKYHNKICASLNISL